MTKEYQANLYEHQGWASLDQYGNTVVLEFIEGKEDTDAPILLSGDWVMQSLSHLEGEILTLVEATVEKDNQKATKDIVRNYIGSFRANVINTTHTEEHTQYMIDLCNPKKNTK